MKSFDEFFLMTTDDVKRYAVEVLHKFAPDEETECIEIGDGNINYVFKIWSKKDGHSVVVKQADKLLRSSGRPLDTYRNKIEAKILQLESLRHMFRRSIITTRSCARCPWKTSPHIKISARSLWQTASTPT